ncbi:hypothetical protein [Peterkaempfera bronchialis]|uniref:hypothetical protein n=1 Tax=Peterkaempfera bronchialis TaxID=2126346 RepID=UPI003C2F05F9
MTGSHARRAAAALIEEVRQDRPEVVRLAQALCLAAHAEPEMVRRARLVFLPSSGLGLEAQLWFSPLVEAADSRALVLEPGVAAELRRDLALRPPPLPARVRAFTEVQHREAPAAVRAFERLLWASAAGRELPEQTVRRELEPFEKALAREDGSAEEIGRWILHFLPRLPGPVRESEAAWRLRVAAAERLGVDLPEEMAVGRDPEELLAARVLARGQVAVGVRLSADGVVLSRPPARDARVCTVVGAARARLALRGALPGAEPYGVDLYDGQQAAVRLDVVALLRGGAVAEARVEMGGAMLCAHGGEGGARAVAVVSGGLTVLRLEGGGTRTAEAGFDGTPELLAVTDDGATAALSMGRTVKVVTLRQGVVETADRELERQPTALGWLRTSDGPLLCAASGRRLLLLPDGGPATALDHPDQVVRLWCSTATGRLATADAAGRVHIWRSDQAGAVAPVRVCEPEGRVTALSVDARSGRVCWALADGGVRLWEPSSDTVRALGPLPRPATGLAPAPGGHTLWAADGGTRLRRLATEPNSGQPDSGEPDGRPEVQRLPFRVRELHPLDDGGLLLVGSGGPLELRSEDGRTQIAALDPSPEAADGGSDSGPGWLRDSIGIELPIEALSGADAAQLLRTARGTGAGHLLVDGGRLRQTGLLPQLSRQAAAAGLRLVADLHPPSAQTEADASAAAAARVKVLEGAAALLEWADGLRLLRGPLWPPDLVGEVRHLVDAYPDAALLASADRSTGAQPIPCHLVVGPAPDPGGPLRPPAPGTGWALPPQPPGGRRPPVRGALLLSLPGCREVPSDLLAESPDARWLRGLLTVRTQQLALLRGGAEAVDSGSRDVVALRRRHHDEEVLCLTNTADRAAATRVECRPGEAALLEIASHRTGEDVAQPSVLHPRSGRFEVPVRPGRARWFRVLDAAVAEAHGLAGGGSAGSPSAGRL